MVVVLGEVMDPKVNLVDQVDLVEVVEEIKEVILSVDLILVLMVVQIIQILLLVDGDIVEDTLVLTHGLAAAVAAVLVLKVEMDKVVIPQLKKLETVEMD